MSTDILHFPARVLVIRAARAATDSDCPDTVLPIYSPDVGASVLTASPPDVLACEVPWSERQSAFHGHPAASTNACMSRTTTTGWPQRESAALQPRLTAGRPVPVPTENIIAAE